MSASDWPQGLSAGVVEVVDAEDVDPLDDDVVVGGGAAWVVVDDEPEDELEPEDDDEELESSGTGSREPGGLVSSE